MHEIASPHHSRGEGNPAAVSAEDSSSESLFHREQREARITRLLALLFFGGALIFAGVAGTGGNPFYLRLATEALIYALVALSADLLLGCMGLLTLGQALYFGLGAYASALLLKDVAPSAWLAIGASLGAGAVAGAIGGFICLRARGVYFALVTYGMAQIAAKIVYNTRELGASDGIIGIPIVSIPLGTVTVKADDPAGFYFAVLGLLAVVYLALAYILNTPFGRVLTAIRVNEQRLPFLGFRPGRFKFAAFVLASAIAALGGSLYPMMRGFVSPELFYFDISTSAVIAVIIGGAGTLVGALYGATALVFAKSIIGSFTEHHQMVIGALFMASVIFFPKGFVGMIKAPSRLRSKR